MISLAAGTVLDAPPAAVLTAAAEAGYDAAGLRLDPASTTTAAAGALGRQAADLGLTLLDLEVVRLRPDRPFDDHLRLLDLAHALDARFLLTVSEHPSHAGTVADLARLAAAARGAATRIALEFMRFTEVHTLTAALSTVDEAGADDAVVLVDALHLQRGGEGPEALAGVDRIGYLQLCDAPAAAPADLADEARHRRLAPGAGELPLASLLAHAPAGLPMSVEVQSDDLRARFGPAERAARLLATARGLLAAGGR
jgi:sugar phosphate isomerase/epimerase